MTDACDGNDCLDRLDRLLDRERSVLLSGNLQELGEVLRQKKDLIDLVMSVDGGEKLADLHGKALRNQALLDSTLRGIRNVATRFANLRRIRKSLETYDEFGHKLSLPAVSDNRMEKRA
jgi:hypothetical protein